MLVDSHCHLDCLDLTPYDGKLALAIHAAREKSVNFILCVCVDLENAKTVLEIAKQHETVWASFGIHPNEKMEKEIEKEMIIEYAQDKKIVAIGETGLDYYRLEGEGDIMQERFRRHIQAARELKKPLIIHTRQAQEDTIKIMKEEKAQEVGGVMHCFTESMSMAQAAMDMGFYISFSGIITFKNAASLREVVAATPLERLLIETDAPYLAPEPYRGKSNEPQYVYYVAEAVAKIKNISFAKVANQTTKNFFSLFKDCGL